MIISLTELHFFFWFSKIEFMVRKHKNKSNIHKYTCRVYVQNSKIFLIKNMCFTAIYHKIIQSFMFSCLVQIYTVWIRADGLRCSHWYICCGRCGRSCLLLSLGQPPKTHKLHRDIHQIRLVSGDSSECRRHVISLLFCHSRDGAFPLHHCSWNGTRHACRCTKTGQRSSPLARFPAHRKRAGKKKREKMKVTVSWLPLWVLKGTRIMKWHMCAAP